jgi:hypothetical protein
VSERERERERERVDSYSEIWRGERGAGENKKEGRRIEAKEKSRTG